MTDHLPRPAIGVNILYGLMGRTIVIHEALLDLCQNAKSAYETAAFLERLIYFQARKIEQGDEPWVYDSRNVICTALRMSERQLKNAIDFLKNDLEVLTTERRMIIYQQKPSTVTHYYIDTDKVMWLLQRLESTPPDPSDDMADGESQKQQVGHPSDDMADGGRTTVSDADSRKASDAYIGTKSQTKSQAKSLISASQDSAAPSTPSAFVLRPKRKTIPPALKAKLAEPEAPQEVPEAPGAEDDYRAPWEVGEPQAERQEAQPPTQSSAPKKPSRKKTERKYPPGAMKAMTDAVMEGAYPEGGVPASKARLAGVKAAELLDAGYAPEDIPEIVKFLKRDPFWRDKITPGSLVSEAPRWKSVAGKRQKKAEPQAPQELTPEMQAELDALNAHFSDNPFGGL